MYSSKSVHHSYFLSTPFWEFLVDYEALAMLLRETFYSLLGVSQGLNLCGGF